MRALIAIALAGMLWLSQSSTARAQDVVALAPISTLGEESRSKKTLATQSLLAAALAKVPGHTIIAGKPLDRAVRKAKRRDLRACDGHAGCLAKLGKLVKARLVVYGELGGLGDARVVYLKVVDVAGAKELRSTTLELGGKSGDDVASRGAAYRLLAPKDYVGELACNVDIKGATIYVDGKVVATSPAEPIKLGVGTHALRVTHPEYRDFVRFVDLSFEQRTVVDVSLKQYAIISKDLESSGKNGAADPGVIYRGQEPTPWYRRWYTIAGGGAALFIGSAVLFGVLANGIDVDDERVVDRP